MIIKIIVNFVEDAKLQAKQKLLNWRIYFIKLLPGLIDTSEEILRLVTHTIGVFQILELYTACLSMHACIVHNP